MKYDRLARPRLVNSESIECRGTFADGTFEKVLVDIPENDQRGVNELFDYICNRYDLDDLRSQYEVELKRHRARQEIEKEKSRQKKENDRLRELFSEKALVFSSQFIKDSDPEVRSALRRAPDKTTLNAIVAHSFNAFLVKNKMSYNDYLDYLDEVMYKNDDDSK